MLRGNPTVTSPEVVIPFDKEKSPDMVIISCSRSADTATLASSRFDDRRFNADTGIYWAVSSEPDHNTGLACAAYVHSLQKL